MLLLLLLLLQTTLAAGCWRKLVAQMTHERAPWYFEKSQPRAWQLDESEGRDRLRVRLERCALRIDENFLLPRSRHLLAPEHLPPPLDYLVSVACGVGVGRGSASIDGLGVGDGTAANILKVVSCCVVSRSEERAGELVLTDACLVFAAETAPPVTWKYESVRQVQLRRYELQERAVEVFFGDGRTVFLALACADERNAVARQLQELSPKLLPADNLVQVTQLWRDKQMTNFQYLTLLNKTAGRSYNDLMQYPIFPFVLADYESAAINLDDPHIYRNFKKPMAVQNEQRDQHYVDNYNYLKRDYENRPHGSAQVVHGPNLGPFHYGSLYSNPGIVLHFLVRLPPFTKLLMDYQDRNFDVPDRSFHSIAVSWRLASSDSTTDVKELIPEFFFLPEFLVNRLGFDFGTQQSGFFIFALP